MDVTFLVGNGFDISTGIDTSYSGFYQWYCTQKPNNDEPEWIRDFKNDILKDMKKPLEERTWADFELGLGRYTANFSPETVDHFIECYEDAVTNLQRYIELQIENKVQDISSSQKDTFAKSILSFTDELPDASKVAMSSILPGKISENVWFRFISFNYTHILDKFVEAVASTPLITWSSKFSYAAQADPRVLHIHGSINDLPLMGVNDVGQIENSIFSVKISIPLENTGISSVFATSVWPFSLIFSLARRNEGNFFQAVPTTLSSSLAEVRLASLVAWA